MKYVIIPQKRTAAVLAGCFGFLLASPALGEGEDAAIDAMVSAFEFSAYHGKNILPEQIPREDWGKYFIVDTRRARDYARAHIPGAVHMEWREVLLRRAELPEDRSVLLYCDTGSLSAQAAFALKASGREDVYILAGGFNGWNLKGGLDAYKRARVQQSR